MRQRDKNNIKKVEKKYIVIVGAGSFGWSEVSCLLVPLVTGCNRRKIEISLNNAEPQVYIRKNNLTFRNKYINKNLKMNNINWETTYNGDGKYKDTYIII